MKYNYKQREKSLLGLTCIMTQLFHRKEVFSVVHMCKVYSIQKGPREMRLHQVCSENNKKCHTREFKSDKYFSRDKSQSREIFLKQKSDIRFTS